jgi:hypothetical protein
MYTHCHSTHRHCILTVTVLCIHCVLTVAHCILTVHSLCIHFVFTLYSLCIQYSLPSSTPLNLYCALYSIQLLSYLPTVHSLCIHCVLTILTVYSLCVHCVFTVCSPSLVQPCTAIELSAHYIEQASSYLLTVYHCVFTVAHLFSLSLYILLPCTHRALAVYSLSIFPH